MIPRDHTKKERALSPWTASWFQSPSNICERWHVAIISSVVEEMGRPFLEESEELFVLDTRDNMNVTVWETVRNVEILGEKQYLRFVKETRVESAKPITELLHQYKLSLFSRPSVKPKSKHKGRVASLTLVYIFTNQRGKYWSFFHTWESSCPSVTIFGRQAEVLYKGRHPSLSCKRDNTTSKCPCCKR